MKQQKHDPSLREKAMAMKQQGMGYSAISKMIDVPLSTVRYWVDPDHRKSVNDSMRKRASLKEQELKQYRADYYKTNKEQLLRRQSAYYFQNKEERKDYAGKYRAERREEILLYLTEWRKNNKIYRKNYRKNNTEKARLYCSNRRARLAAVPQPHGVIEKMMVSNYYEYAKALEAQTGTKYHVDHIWPISKGGPHLPWNLQILTATDNMTKGASLIKEKPRHPVFLGFRHSEDL